MRFGGLKKAFAGVAVVAMVLGFQNCSDFVLQDQILYEQGLFASQRALDEKSLPILLNSEELSYWSKPGNPTFVAKSLFVANQISVVAAVDRAITGKIISVNSGANQEDAFITVAEGKVRATHAAPSSGSYSFLEVPLPAAGEKMVISAGFGVKPTEISLLINGVVQSGTIQTVSTPENFSYTAKSVVAGGSGGQIYEYVIFGGNAANGLALTKSDLNVMARYIATNNLIANVVFDPSLIEGRPGSPEENPKFAPVKALLDAKCVHCHAHSSNLKDMTEAKALANNWVRAKNLAGSPLYYRLKGATAGAGPANMPTDGAVSAEEVQAVADWINSIEN